MAVNVSEHVTYLLGTFSLPGRICGVPIFPYTDWFYARVKYTQSIAPLR